MNSHSLLAEVSHGEANKLSLLSVLPRRERPPPAGKNSQKTTVKQSLQVLNVDWQFCFCAFAYLSFSPVILVFVCFDLSFLSFRVLIHSFFFYKNVVFPAQAEYSYFSADFRLKIFLCSS